MELSEWDRASAITNVLKFYFSNNATCWRGSSSTTHRLVLLPEGCSRSERKKKSEIPVEEKNGRINFTWNINLIIIFFFVSSRRMLPNCGLQTADPAEPAFFFLQKNNQIKYKLVKIEIQKYLHCSKFRFRV